MFSEKMRTGHSAMWPAQTVKHHSKPYQSCAQQSSVNLKEKIGTLLLALQAPLNRKQQENGWELFGVMLRQYVDLKYGRVG